MAEQVLERLETGPLVPVQPTRTCRLFVVRHGTTTLNVQNRYRGRRDVPLDAQGYQDAVNAARRLSGEGLAAVYTGPLRRTIATAQIIADEARLPELRILHGLINLDYGLWEGLTAEEAAECVPEEFERYKSDPLKSVCPSGERLADAQQRIVESLIYIGNHHPGEAVTAVTHAVMIRLACARLTGVTGEGWRLPVSRGGCTEFTVLDGELRLVALPTGSDAGS